MPEIVFHVGFGKTGSSSLQTYLSRTAAQKIGDSSYVYCAFARDGRLLSGPDIANKANLSLLRYVNSYHEIHRVSSLDEARNSIYEKHKNGFIPVFSQEAWGNAAPAFAEAQFFERIDCDVRIIAYVRPQVDWFNAGWWQWWAWDSKFTCPQDVLELWGCHFMKWAAQLKRWAELPRVRNVTVRVHGTDVISDFLKQLGIENAPPVISDDRKNVSINPTAIKLYRAIEGLRTPHGAELDAIFAPLFDDHRRAPWVVTPDTARTIISETRFDNIALLDYLDKQQVEEIQNDLRWWEPAAFADCVLVSESDMALTTEECIAIIRKLINSNALHRSLNIPKD